MESLYPATRHGTIPAWHQGTAAEQAPGKANELVLPDGRRP